MPEEGRTRQRRVARLQRWHRLLLGVYPPAFRARWGGEVERLFGDRIHDMVERRGTSALWVVWLSVVWDALRNAPAEWVHEWFRRSGEATWPKQTRRQGMVAGMDGWRRDIHLGIRSLRRNAGFAAIAILTIGVGIGLNTSIFSVARAVLLSPLPYAEPDRLVLVWTHMVNRNVNHFPTSPGDFQDFRQLTTQFEDFAGVWTFQQTLTQDGEPEVVDVAGVTPNFFTVLGVRPALGRNFVEADGTPNAGPEAQEAPFNTVAILSHGLWQRRFGGDPSVVGRVIDFDGNPTEIVGVLPADFRLLMPTTANLSDNPELYFAGRIQFENASRINVFLRPIARLKPGVTLAQAQAEMDRMAADLRSRFPIKETAGVQLPVTPMHEALTGSARPLVLALVGAVFFVLLIACANVANLLLVRATAREREMAVRVAVGGGRGQLIRQMLVESLVLAGTGGILGVGLAWAGIRVLRVLEPAELPRIGTIAIDPAALAFTAAATVAAALIFGIVPALRASRPDLTTTLREGGRTPGLSANRVLRNGVVIAEVALSLVLLIGAGLMVRSFLALQRVDPGWNPDNVLTFDVPLSFARYGTPELRLQFVDRLRTELGALPGVEAVTASTPLPLSGIALNGRWGKAEALADPAAFQQADFTFVAPDYFETMDTRLIAGRTFTSADHADSTAIVVIDEILAQKAFPNGQAVGERILVRVNSPEPEWVEIIGVVEHQRRASLAEDGRETVFFTHRFGGGFAALSWIVRTNGDPTRAANSVRSTIAGIDPLLPISNLTPLDSYVSRAMASTRFALVLIACFGGVALLLAAVGLYGVLAYAVRQRTAEIGLRVAMGATQQTILGLVVRQGLALSMAGIAFGTVGAFALTRVMRSLLVGVTPTDPLTFGSIGLAFLVVAMLASWLPARRAANVDPITALRTE